MMDTCGSQDDEHVLIARYAAMLQNQQHEGHQNGLPQQTAHHSQAHNGGAPRQRRLPQMPHTQVNMQHIPTAPPTQPQPPLAINSSTQNVMMQQSQDGGSKEQIIAELEARNRLVFNHV